MALFNHVTKSVNAKIVYYGPGCSGKETSVTHICRGLNPEYRSNLKALAVQGSRMFFFDFSSPEYRAEGYDVRFHLYTLTGASCKPSTWKSVLAGADGIVFVADSDPGRQQENLNLLSALQAILVEEGNSLDRIPFVIQYNRRDLPAAVPLDEMQRQLNCGLAPGFPTTALTGDGVMAPLTSLTRMILATIREELDSGVAAAVEAECVDDVTIAPEALLRSADPPESGEISLAITGTGTLAEGRLTIPVRVTAASGCRDYRLVVALESAGPSSG